MPRDTTGPRGQDLSQPEPSTDTTVLVFAPLLALSGLQGATIDHHLSRGTPDESRAL
jgi:hypothetical protein